MCCSSNVDWDLWLKLGGLVIGIVGAIVPFFQWVQTKRSEDRDRRFRNYHRMIKELVSPEGADGVIWYDRQKAILFELREYRVYHEVTERILEGLLEKWKSVQPPGPGFPRLIHEAELTLDFIRARR